MFRNLTFPLGINIVCLIITAIAPTLAIGPVVGWPLGLACSFGLLAAMEYQRSADGHVRSAAMMLVWLIRFFAVTLEQMAYQDAFEDRKSLPFGLDAMWWGWIAPVVMGALDIMAYYITAARAAATSSAADHAANLARADELDNARREREAEKERVAYAQQLELARLAQDAETRRAELAHNANVEIARSENMAKADAEKARSEAAKAKAEADRKRSEVGAERERNQAEAKRKDAEAARKRAEEQAEARRKEAEQRRNQQESERRQTEKIKAEKEAADADARAKTARWKEATAAERLEIIQDAEIEAGRSLNRKPTQAEIAAIVGVTDRTIRETINNAAAKQAA